MLDRELSLPHMTKKTGVFLGALSLGVTALLLPSCTPDVNENEQIQEGRSNATTEDVAENIEELTGQEITVRSEVEQVVGDSGFLIESDTGEAILVVNTTGAAFTLPSGDMPIQATGEAAQFVIADIERDYGLDLEDELYVDYENQPAIIANSLALAPRAEDLAAKPTGYFDKEIAVNGEVRALEGTNNAFALYEEGWVDDIGILVLISDINLQEDIPIQEGENIVVTGTARQADASLLQEANLGWDEAKTQEFLSRYTDRPVIVADSLYPSALDPDPDN
jgi:hypothetical protein